MNEKFAKIAYDAYCAAVGGKAFNGDPLPPAAEFWADPNKAKQAAAWEAAVSAAFDALPPIESASVKVMRSHDYCHFEIQLGTDDGARTSLHQVDLLRKEAARLADKAVEQYKVAKTAAWKLEASGRKVEADRIRGIAEPDRTPEQKAVLKAYQDSLYDYQDDWSDDYD